MPGPLAGTFSPDEIFVSVLPITTQDGINRVLIRCRDWLGECLPGRVTVEPANEIFWRYQVWDRLDSRALLFQMSVYILGGVSNTVGFMTHGPTQLQGAAAITQFFVHGKIHDEFAVGGTEMLAQQSAVYYADEAPGLIPPWPL